MRRPLRILLIGSTGVFGARIAERLAGLGGLELVLAARSADRLRALQARLAPKMHAMPPACLPIDRTTLGVETLMALEADLVIDAAGPFQGAAPIVARAAIAAGVNYLDIADARDFVGAIGALDREARTKGVFVLAGASTTPALSCAVLDELTVGFRRIDRVTAAILPGNRVPRGPAVMRAILSTVGQRARVFRGGGWVEERAWTRSRSVGVPGLPARPAAVCDTPDLDIFVARYRPRVAAEFLAGLELAVLHHGLGLLGAAVRSGLVRSLAPLAPSAARVAGLLERFGSDRGGMLVEAVGVDGSGETVRVGWSLVAEAGSGPHVPTLPVVAIVEAILAGSIPAPGARACVGELRLADFERQLSSLPIRTTRHRAVVAPSPLFATALGPAFDLLPPATRRVHSPAPEIVLEGAADIDGAESGIGRLLAWLLSLPAAGRGVPVKVVIAVEGRRETWRRSFAGRQMRSVMSRADPWSRTIEERFGAVSVVLRVEASRDGLELIPVGAKLLGLTLPAVLLPRATASEAAGKDGSHRFDVEIGLPLIGRLVHYRGEVAEAGAG